MTKKEFFDRYFYNSVKMFVRQLVIAMFGVVITLATDGVYQILASIFAVLFYLFLVYETSFSTGSRDSVIVSFKPNPATGLIMSLIANVPNFLLAILFLVGTLASFSDSTFTNAVSQIGGVCGIIALFAEGMYTGLLTVNIGGAALNTYWFSYFIIIIPALLVSTIGYIFGLKNIHATSILIPTTPEEEERRKEQKRRRKDETDE